MRDIWPNCLHQFDFMTSLVPVGGLCNRMRAMDAALALHRVTGVPLRVYWESNALLNCPFHRLSGGSPGRAGRRHIWSSRLLLRFGRFHAAARALGRATGTTYYHHDENERLELDVATEQLHKLRQLHIISFARFHQIPRSNTPPSAPYLSWSSASLRSRTGSTSGPSASISGARTMPTQLPSAPPVCSKRPWNN